MIGSLFRKNEKSLLDAWQQVLDEADPTDWALFGYEGQSDSLKVLATGDQGLDELALEVNPGQVMYAFVRVIHPKTKITTFVIINWVGEGAPIQRKATSAAHQFEVRKFFKYSNLCIHARLEEDVEEANVLEQLAKSATTDYDFGLKSCAREEDIKPVGTNYVRVKADKEINLKDRNNFWSKMEAEERKRKQEEIKAIEEERRKEEKNRQEREIRASKAREELLRLQEEQLEKQKKAEALAQEKKKAEQRKLEELEEKIIPETVRTVNKFQMDVALNEREKFWAQQEEEERARRLEEQHRKDSLKDEQLNCIANIKNKFSQMNEKTLEDKQVKNNSEIRNGNSNQVVNENLNNGNSLCQNTNGKVTHLNSVKFTDVQEISQCESPSLQETNLDEELNVEAEMYKNSSLLQEEEEELYDDQLDNDYCLDNSIHLSGYGGVRWASSDRLEVIAEEEEEEQDNLKILLAGKGICAKAIYDYQADDDQEISFDPDDIITNIKQTFDTWWEGLGPDNKFGLFPANYVELLN